MFPGRVELTGPTEPLGSVVIPAHDESAGIRRCLDALFAGTAPGELDVVVVCNGCSDDTAALGAFVRSSAARDRARSGIQARRAADGRRGSSGVPPALPRRRRGAARAGSTPRAANGFGTARSPHDHRSTTTAAARLPPCAATTAPGRAFRPSSDHCGARGSTDCRSQGGAASTTFPDVVADDLWVDRQFAPGEIEIVDCAPVEVAVPRRRRRPPSRAAADLPWQVADRRRRSTRPGARDHGFDPAAAAPARRGRPVRGPRRRHVRGVCGGRPARRARSHGRRCLMGARRQLEDRLSLSREPVQRLFGGRRGAGPAALLDGRSSSAGPGMPGLHDQPLIL